MVTVGLPPRLVLARAQSGLLARADDVIQEDRAVTRTEKRVPKRHSGGAATEPRLGSNMRNKHDFMNRPSIF